MRLNELLEADSIIIQCHNNPDADALASGYGVYAYLKSHGKEKLRFVYGGRELIQKSNLVLMVDRLGIPIEHVEGLEEEPDLLVTVDCQPGQRNVLGLSGRKVAAIDHHEVQQRGLAALWTYDLRPNCGACSTIVWDLLRRESDFDLYGDQKLITALYYGLFMDTCSLQQIYDYEWTDRVARNDLEKWHLEDDLRVFKTNNLAIEEVKLVGKALESVTSVRSEALRNGKDDSMEHYFAVAEAKPCDPNILGIIADQLNEVEGIDICVVYYVNRGVKLSIRSSTRNIRANELAHHLSGGGGHQDKAGGWLDMSKIEGDPTDFLITRTKNYIEDQDLIHVGEENTPDLSEDPMYQKRPVEIGYVRAAEVYEPGTHLRLLMLEGDEVIEVTEGLYLIVGVDYEVYYNSTKEKFESRNDWSEKVRSLTPEQLRKVEDAVSGVDVETRPLEGHIRSCTPKGTSFIRARELTRRTKVFSVRGDCFQGRPGDYLVVSGEDPMDMYIVRGDIFKKTYDRVEQ